MSVNPEIRNLLIITSSAGGGLLQAAIAQEQQAKAENAQIQIIKRDVLKDWLWRWLGEFSIQSWNIAQKKGNVKIQKALVSFHWLFDYIAWPSVFFHTLRILFKEDIDRVIDTQTTSTSAIIKAIRIFNKKRSKQVVLEKVVVDLPTKKATHFFRPIRILSKNDKKHLKLRTIPPLLEEGQTSEEFWRTHCGVPESEICYEDVNVRQSFRNFQAKPRSASMPHLHLRFKNSEELHLMQKTWKKGSIHGTIIEDSVRFNILENAKVITILLGSQPARAATVNYVKNFIQIVSGLQQGSPPVYLFVFCADHKPGSRSLLCEVAEAVENAKEYPSLLSVIPFSFQDDDAIAPLFHRSDATCSRSGGGTAMELMAVSTGKIWIHSEAKKKSGDLSLKQLLGGIPVWESESALYLVNLFGAELVTPETFSSNAFRLLTLCKNS